MNKTSYKNARKGLVLVCLCIILLVIYGIIRIYALFHSELYAKVQLENGIWNIIVNGTDITKGADIAFLVDSLQPQENEHVKPGKLAPGLIGNFKININPKDTDVSIKYEISLEEEKITNSNMQIKSVKETLEENVLIRTGQNTYTGIITLEDIKLNKTNEITVEIEWIDNEENNEPDIEIGTIWNAEYQIPITVHVCQYLGEEITPYEEAE